MPLSLKGNDIALQAIDEYNKKIQATTLKPKSKPNAFSRILAHCILTSSLTPSAWSSMFFREIARASYAIREATVEDARWVKKAVDAAIKADGEFAKVAV